MSEENKGESRSPKLETICGLLLAVFAASLAITDLGGGKYGDDEIMGTNEKSNTYMWYQSKGIKQNIAEGQRDLLKALSETGVIAEDKKGAVDNLLTKITNDISRYKKEKEEILHGSKAVGKENWVQEMNGKLGEVTGVDDWNNQLLMLGRAGDHFDSATLFLQLCLVMGAITLITPVESAKKGFFWAMIVLGVIGTCFTVYGFTVVQ